MNVFYNYHYTFLNKLYYELGRRQKLKDERHRKTCTSKINMSCPEVYIFSLNID